MDTKVGGREMEVACDTSLGHGCGCGILDAVIVRVALGLAMRYMLLALEAAVGLELHHYQWTSEEH